MSQTFKKLSVFEKSSDFRKAVRVVEVPLVPPPDDQVLVKVIYVGIYANDVTMAADRFFGNKPLPFDIGQEALGVVENVSENITSLKVGQPVVYWSIIPKAFTEYMYAGEDELIPVPCLKPEFLGLLICGLTPAIGLDMMGRLKPSDKVLITASAGATGHVAVQLAKQKGCYVIGMTSSAEKEKLLKELGTDRVINYKTEDLNSVLTKEYPNGVDVIWETIGGQVFETLFKHLAVKGRMIIIGGTSGYKEVGIPSVQIPNLPTTLLMKNQTLSGFLIYTHKELHHKYLNQLIDYVMSGKLRIVLDMGNTTSEGPFVGLDSVIRGVEHLYRSKSIGKVVVKIQNE